VYSEFYNDRFYIFDTPQVFLPRDIDFGPDALPHESTARISVFTDPSGTGNFERTGKETRAVVFHMRGIEDVVINAIEYKDVFVIEKNTTHTSGTVKETMWLAHSIGPVKRVVRSGSQESVYTVISYEGAAHVQRTRYPVREMFPLNEGEHRIYQDHAGSHKHVRIGHKEAARLHADVSVVPYHEPCGDILYFKIDRRGLAIPQRFWESYGGITSSLHSDNAGAFLPGRISIGSYYRSYSKPRSYNARSLSHHDFNNPEELYAATVLKTEDVRVPAGTFKNCLKIHVLYVISNFEIQFDAISTGFVWLAPGTGIVKEEKMQMMNTSLPESSNSIFNAGTLMLSSIKRTDQAAEKRAAEQAAPASAPETSICTVKEFDALKWELNSRNMFNRVIEEIPFFIRPLAAPKFRRAIAQKAGNEGIVTEQMVVACAREETLPKYVDQVMSAVEPLKTREKK